MCSLLHRGGSALLVSKRGVACPRSEWRVKDLLFVCVLFVVFLCMEAENMKFSF